MFDDYDGLSLPSMRARLHKLDLVQLKEWAEYEKKHAARDPGPGPMFERRIDKLEHPDMYPPNPGVNKKVVKMVLTYLIHSPGQKSSQDRNVY